MPVFEYAYGILSSALNFINSKTVKQVIAVSYAHATRRQRGIHRSRSTAAPRENATPNRNTENTATHPAPCAVTRRRRRPIDAMASTATRDTRDTATARLHPLPTAEAETAELQGTRLAHLDFVPHTQPRCACCRVRDACRCVSCARRPSL